MRVQDIIGLILAILIVAILISIILILRESAKERKMWKDDYEDYDERSKSGRKLTPEKKLPTGKIRFSSLSGVESLVSEVETKRKWNRIPREREVPKNEPPAEEEVVVEKIPPRPPTKSPVPPVTEKPMAFERQEAFESFPADTVRKIPLAEHRVSREPRQAVLERGLKKLAEMGLEIKSLKVVLDDENIEFAPLLWEVRDMVQSGKAIGDIVIHTAFKVLPGHSGEEVVELYRSGDLSVVDKLEVRVKIEEGQDYLVAVLHLSYFRLPDLMRLHRNGTLSEEELELLNALKFVDRSTKKDLARVVYSKITNA
ncbi:MAG TPA: hypothetical protein VLH40_02500 [Atribacteraceae bacterium]|nr:hypothetical protein [Atribacteraceae bacterium]